MENAVQLTNRWLYVLHKKITHLSDPVIRPSLMILYDAKTIECDVAHFDPIQLASFLIAYNKTDIVPLLEEYTSIAVKKAIDLINSN